MAASRAVPTLLSRGDNIEAKYLEVRVKGKGGFKPLHSHDSKTGAVGIGKILISKLVEDPPSPSFNLFINGHDLNLIALFD